MNKNELNENNTNEAMNNENVANQPQQETVKSRKDKFWDALPAIIGIVIIAIMGFFAGIGMSAAPRLLREMRHNRETRRAEAQRKNMLPPSIDWNHYDYLVAAPDNVAAFIDKNDPYHFFLNDFNREIEKLHDINRPANIAWDNDSTAFEKRFVSRMEMPSCLHLRRSDDLINELKADPDLQGDLFRWMTKSVRRNSPNTDGADILIGLIVNHMRDYLENGGLQKDSIYLDFCKSHDMEGWFFSPNRLIEQDGAYYLAEHTIDKPYRSFEVFLYELVYDYGVSPKNLILWLDYYSPVTEDLPCFEVVLPQPPAIISGTYYDYEGDTIWLSDLAMEWIIELRDAVEYGFDNWDELMEYIELEYVVGYHFHNYYHLETDYIVRSIRQELLEQPQLFDALVEWMSPTVATYLAKLNETEKQIVNEHIAHLLDYLHNGSYEHDLEYEKNAEPISPGFSIEYAPDDFIILDGEIYEGLGENPYRWDEVRLFVALQYGIGKDRFEKLMKRVMAISL